MVEETPEDIFAEGTPLFGKERQAEKPMAAEKLEIAIERATTEQAQKRVDKVHTNIPIENLAEIMDKQSTPTDFEDSEVHGLLTRDVGLSNYPNFAYVDMLTAYQDSAAHFALIGEKQIALYIIFKVQNRGWTIQGEGGFLRKSQNESRAVITKTENKTESSSQTGGGLLPKLR